MTCILQVIFFTIDIIFGRKIIVMSLTIAVHLASGFEEIEAVCVIDVLRRAGLDVKVVSVIGKYEVTGAHQIQFVADILFEQMDYSDVYMIVLPGGNDR